MEYSERIYYANILMIMQIELKKPKSDWGNAKKKEEEERNIYIMKLKQLLL